MGAAFQTSALLFVSRFYFSTRFIGIQEKQVIAGTIRRGFIARRR
jgi:hypothetical protein